MTNAVRSTATGELDWICFSNRPKNKPNMLKPREMCVWEWTETPPETREDLLIRDKHGLRDDYKNAVGGGRRNEGTHAVTHAQRVALPTPGCQCWASSNHSGIRTEAWCQPVPPEPPPLPGGVGDQEPGPEDDVVAVALEGKEEAPRRLLFFPEHIFSKCNLNFPHNFKPHTYCVFLTMGVTGSKKQPGPTPRPPPC